jgi:NhaA family Na+:H+ antiporter
MVNSRFQLSDTFNRFFESEKSGGLVLIAATIISLFLANSSMGPSYVNFWDNNVLGLSIAEWINDGLMAIFFLLIGLELEREIYTGELSNPKSASLPFFAALGGMILPALIHYSFNYATPTQDGAGIPMATDIAFALGALALLGNKIPPALKVFVVAFAVIDDLGAIVVIGMFYSHEVSAYYLLAAMTLWIGLVVLNNRRIMSLYPYVIGGTLLWFLMLKSGVHPTIAGVMLAFAIPFTNKLREQASPSYKLEKMLHKPAAFLILPLFALANTAITFEGNLSDYINTANFAGISLGLIIGKPLGVIIFSFIGITLGFSKLPAGVKWSHLLGAGILGGIGFTMSIFITNLAFHDLQTTINASKIAIMFASLTAGALGYIWLKYRAK